MRIIIYITTYNRSSELESTLNDLFSDKDFFAQNKVSVKVYDDKSEEPYVTKNKGICKRFRAEHIVSQRNFGKKGFWRLHKKILQDLAEERFDYTFSLQDDYTYEDKFLTKALNLLTRLEKENLKTVCLNLQDNRIGQKNWITGQNSNELINIDGVSLWKVNWCDCVFLANRQFFKLLNFEIFPINKTRWKRRINKSSGVGQQVSQRISSSKSGIYQPTVPLITHLGVQTQIGRQK